MDNKPTEKLDKLVDFSTIDGFCTSINALAPNFNATIANEVTPELLTTLAKTRYRQSAYTQFKIPKKSGGERTILAPSQPLMDFLKTLNFMLSAIYTPNDSAMGFVSGRSVKQNASRHLNKNYVFNTDISNFFPSISATQVEHALIKANVAPDLAKLLSLICSYPLLIQEKIENVLPQGAPTSPILSNICCEIMDARLVGLAKRFHLDYSRYADDITFSSNHSVYKKDGDFRKELCQILADNGFTMNEAKTRLQKRGARQEVTGVIVSEKVNVSRTYVKQLRSLIFKIACSSSPSKHMVRVAQGKLNYMRMIKGAEDSAYKTLCIKLNLAVKGKHFAKQ